MSPSFRRRGRPFATLISLAALACAALAGCASQSAAPSVSFPSASAPPTLDMNAAAASSGIGSSGSTFDGQGVATSITAKIIDSTGTVGTYPNGWETFTVVVYNASATAVPNLAPLVVFGTCTCDPAAGGVPPRSLLQVYDTETKAWTSAASVSVNASGGFAFERQAAVATLPAHASLTYRYRTILSLGKQTSARNGAGSIQVYVVQQPRHVRITDASGPDASLALAYTVN